MPKGKQIKTLRVILGDQLNSNHSWFENVDDEVIYLMMEVHEECSYVKHHIQKILAIFNAMRAFREELSENGHEVHYIALDDPENKKSILSNVIHWAKKYNVDSVQIQEPDEYRLYEDLKQLKNEGFDIHFVDAEHFITTRNSVEDFFEGKKSWVMEYFYRELRQKHNILMDGSSPEGGSWNYDEKNRKKLPKNHQPPQPLFFGHDVTDLHQMIDAQNIEYIGTVKNKQFNWPINKNEAEEQLSYFIDYLLPNFGAYQDAMHTEWAFIYHSRLSFALNTKILHPLQVIQKVEKAYKENKSIDIAQAEGFIRQILGWREFVRGIYWSKMPNYADENFFDNDADLPAFYWSGNTDMKCLQKSIQQSLTHAYAHHIQRLMVTGNFALLAGVHPNQVDAWYLGIYIDAFEWVEMPNTRGMSQFADGGVMGTKPYVSSGSYINKMSNYCKNCKYNVKHKTEDDACPFNSLYWNFIDKNRSKLENNHRMRMMYATWDKMSDKADILARAEKVLENINNL